MWFTPDNFWKSIFFSDPELQIHQFLNVYATFLHTIDHKIEHYIYERLHEILYTIRPVGTKLYV